MHIDWIENKFILEQVNINTLMYWLKSVQI